MKQAIKLLQYIISTQYAIFLVTSCCRSSSSIEQKSVSFGCNTKKIIHFYGCSLYKWFKKIDKKNEKIQRE